LRGEVAADGEVPGGLRDLAAVVVGVGGHAADAGGGVGDVAVAVDHAAGDGVVAGRRVGGD